MSSKQQLLSSEIEIEFNNIDYYWHQGQTGFIDAQKSALFRDLNLLNEALDSFLDIMENEQEVVGKNEDGEEETLKQNEQQHN